MCALKSADRLKTNEMKLASYDAVWQLIDTVN